MTKRGRGGVLIVCAMSIGAWTVAMAEPTEPAPKAKSGKPAPAPAEEDSPYVDVAKGDIGAGDGSIRSVGGGGGMTSSAVCMAADEAMAKTKEPKNTESLPGSSSATTQSKQVPECPTAIWVWVGAGHGARPVGNVQTPFMVASTRKRRQHHKHDCCYLVQQSPGRPNG